MVQINAEPVTMLYYGSAQPLPTPRPLRAGPLSLVFEEGDLRYLRWGECEVLRRIGVAVRDHNWDTVPPVLTDLQIDAGADHFQIEYAAEHRQGDINFYWQAQIVGETDGTIRFTLDGAARSTFRRNRIGFCVLHPSRECAGRRCIVEHVDGSVTEAVFPEHISAQQPFCEIRALKHEVYSGAWVEVRFEGEVFELEDQRNWIDASYKTYGTPLRLPFPVEIKAGTRIAQSVTLQLQGRLPRITTRPRAESVTLTVGTDPVGRCPQLGLGAASDGQPLSAQESARLKALNLAHLRVDLHLAQPGWATLLRQTSAEAAALGASLEVALFLSDRASDSFGDELTELCATLAEINPTNNLALRSWLVFHEAEKVTSAKWVKLARARLAAHAPLAKFGAGTNAYFAELNRARPPVEVLDFVSYSINPQVHAFDNDSLVETLEALPATIASARRFTGNLPLHISPVTLKPRFNPNATGPNATGPESVTPDALPPQPPQPPQVDVRQMSLFGAGWTVGCLKRLAECGVASVTFYETTGWRGVMERAAGSPSPHQFPSWPGAVFPLYHALADVGEVSAGEVIPVTSSDALRVDGLAVRYGDRLRLLLANFRPAAQRVRLRNLRGPLRVRSLDETNARTALLAPEDFRQWAGQLQHPASGELELELLPYATVRVDSGV